MPIDLLNLARTLLHVITSLQKQYDDYNTLQDNKKESLVAFWKAFSRLTDDLRIYHKFIETLHKRQPAFGSFIRSADSIYWDDFESALNDIQSRYHELQCREQPCSDLERNGVAKRIVASFIFCDVLTSSIKQINTATASLVSDVETIERAYKRLYSSYILHIFSSDYQSITSQKPVTGVLSAVPDTIDTVVSSFHRNPFCLSTTTVSADTLFRLNLNREVVEQVTRVMREEGASWAEKLTDLDNINEFNQIQKFAMEVLWATCIPQMESEKLQFARLGDERISNASLKELSDSLKSAIARANTQSFSIAFCGMVKAG